MTPDLFKHLWHLWRQEEPRMFPYQRGRENFKFLLSESDGNEWFQVKETVLIVSPDPQGVNLDAITLGLERAPRNATMAEIADILDTYGAHRMTIRIPESAKKVKRAAHRLGFEMEGVIRDAEYIDGMLENVIILGVLRPHLKQGDKDHATG